MNKIKILALTLIIIFVSNCSNSVLQESNSLQNFFRYKEGKEILVSAHRGGKGYAGYPENCLETMEFIKRQIPNAIFEIDVAKSKDGVLFLMHDYSLERTTNGSGKVEECNWEELKKLKLKDDFGTLVDYRIPLFEAVLKWAKKENSILTVDIKKSVDAEEVLRFIEENNALLQSVIITYSMETAQRLYQLNPEVVLSVSIRNMEEFNRAANSGIPWENMVAFTGTKTSSSDLYNKLHEKGVMCMLGTLGNLDKKATAKGDHLYREWAASGVDIFATDRALEVHKTLCAKVY